MTDDELLRAACPKIGEFGWAFYFVPETMERGKELGIDGFRFYFLGRGGVLGDVEAPVVSSAFGYFNPDLVASMWDSGRQVLAPRDAAREYVACCHRFGRSRLEGLDGLEDLCQALEVVNASARARSAALALYAGWAAEPLPEDLPARVMQLVTTLRELRGSAHLVAVVASGLEPRTAHFLARPEMYTTFGWSEDEPPAVSEEDRARLAAAETKTDELVRPAFAALDEAGRQALVRGLRAMGERLRSA